MAAKNEGKNKRPSVPDKNLIKTQNINARYSIMVFENIFHIILHF